MAFGKVIILAILAALIAFSGCTQVNQIFQKDCGNNQTCFANAVNKCEPAKSYIETGGISVSSQIKGLEKNVCILQIEAKAIDSPVPAVNKTCSIEHYDSNELAVKELGECLGINQNPEYKNLQVSWN